MMTKAFKPSQSRNTTLFGFAITGILGAVMLSTLFSLRNGSIAVLGLTSAALLALIGVFAFLTVSGRRMTYELDEKGLHVRLAVGGTRIPYANIADAQQSYVAFTVRVFGGSWPGFHFGLFRASGLGNVTVYTTKMSGEFALLSLTDGRKVVLSPEDVPGFLAELNARRGMFGSSGGAGTGAGTGMAAEPEQMPKIVHLQVAVAIAAYVCLLAYFLSVYPSLPQTIPLHFDFDWNPNRWGDKSELLALMGIAAIFPAINTVVSLKFWKYGRCLSVAMTAIFTLVIVLFFAILHMTVGMA